MTCASDGRAGCLLALALALLCGAVAKVARPRAQAQAQAGKTPATDRRALCGVDMVRLLVDTAYPVA